LPVQRASQLALLAKLIGWNKEELIFATNIEPRQIQCLHWTGEINSRVGLRRSIG